jgi:hypothetical protein
MFVRETAMNVSSFIIAAAALTLSSGVVAEPPKVPAGAPARPAPVELASADLRPALNPQRPDLQPVKRPRTMRVTSCRCGDPQPGPESTAKTQ